jgi:hypothetical protein
VVVCVWGGGNEEEEEGGGGGGHRSTCDRCYTPRHATAEVDLLVRFVRGLEGVFELTLRLPRNAQNRSKNESQIYSKKQAGGARRG